MVERRVRQRSTSPKPPGFPVGRVQMARGLFGGDLLSRLDLFDVQQSDIIGWRVGPKRFFLSRSPEHVEHVFIGAQERYRKSVHYRLIAAVTGDGLLTAEGDQWARSRRLVQPVFAKRNLDALMPHMVGATDDFLARWEQLADGATVDVAEAMSEVTLDVVGRALFGSTLSDAADRLRPAVVVGLRTGVAAARLQMMLALPRRLVDLGGRVLGRLRLLPPPLRRIGDAMRTIDEEVKRIIDLRIAEPSQIGEDADLLDLLLASRDEDGTALDRRQVRDEVVTLMLAGHETTANGLAWMWHLLGDHPDALDRMLDEVDTVLGGRPPTPDALGSLPWTTACFQEAMRLYPPAWVLEREAVTDDLLGGYRIPRGSTVIFPVWSIHRDPRSWDAPDRFDPERFLPGRPPPPRGTYLPFGAGRRVCVGAAFAQMEAVVIAAMTSQRHRLEPVPSAEIVPEPTVTLRPRDGLPMRVQRR